MRYLSKHFLILYTVFCLGCVQPQSNLKSSASISISKKYSLEAIKGALIEVYTNDGWDLEQESTSRVQFIKYDDRVLAQAIMGTNYDRAIWHRESVTIANLTDNYKLMARQTIISNRGSSFERVTPTNTAASSRFNRVSTILGVSNPTEDSSPSE